MITIGPAYAMLVTARAALPAADRLTAQLASRFPPVAPGGSAGLAGEAATD